MEKYQEEIYMVSGLDSLGVPYTLDNKDSKAFIDLFVENFRQNVIKIEYVNLCSLAKNKTWELIDILERDFTKQEYYRRNKKYAEFVINNAGKSNRFDHPINPNFINNYYNNVENPEIKITSKLKTSDNPIFLYSCGGMNFDFYTKMPTCDLKQIIPELVFNLGKNIDKTMNDIHGCINYISKLNQNIEIYVLGVYAMLENKALRNIAQPLYALYNSRIKKICSEYSNVHYVDIFDAKKYVAYHDNHPTFEGQKYIAKQIIKTMTK